MIMGRAPPRYLMTHPATLAPVGAGLVLLHPAIQVQTSPTVNTAPLAVDQHGLQV